MKFVLLSALFYSIVPLSALAAVPSEATPERAIDVITVENPEVRQSYYGRLEGFPHTYAFTADNPFRLSVEVLIPDTREAAPVISGIIVKDTEGGRVQEVGRLVAGDVAWQATRDWSTNDWYHRGPTFDEELTAGSYRLEISSPDNTEVYALRLGHEEGGKSGGTIATIRDIAKVKDFFGKSELSTFEAPSVFLPTLIVFLAILSYALWRRKDRKSGVV